MTQIDNKVNFFPTKRLLVEIITKDINIRDSILDLIDNSVDSYVRRKIKERRKVKIEISNKSLIIEDNCGGIDKDTLVNHVFRSGELSGLLTRTIGYYGIGLKRALFKLASEFTFETYDGKDYSKIKMNVNEWEKNDEDWGIPLQSDHSIVLKGKGGFTRITIDKYKEEVPRVISTIFVNDLKGDLGRYYTRVIESDIDFIFNEEKVEAFDLEAEYSKEMKPTHIEGSIEKGKYKIYCWLEPKGENYRDIKAKEKNGWNIFMNDRLIMINDKSAVTGWSGKKNELPNYHNIYNQFRGIVMVEANDPGALPINTTKNNFNLEHQNYYEIKKKMIEVSRPILSYLNKKYNKGRIEEIDSEIANEIKNDIVEVNKLERKPIDSLKLQPKFTPKKLVKESDSSPISYKKPKKQIEKIKRVYKLKNNKEVGEYTFDYFWNFGGMGDE